MGKTGSKAIGLLLPAEATGAASLRLALRRCKWRRPRYARKQLAMNSCWMDQATRATSWALERGDKALHERSVVAIAGAARWREPAALRRAVTTPLASGQIQEIASSQQARLGHMGSAPIPIRKAPGGQGTPLRPADSIRAYKRRRGGLSRQRRDPLWFDEVALRSLRRRRSQALLILG